MSRCDNLGALVKVMRRKTAVWMANMLASLTW
jgi:hypothetical protein